MKSATAFVLRSLEYEPEGNPYPEPGFDIFARYFGDLSDKLDAVD